MHTTFKLFALPALLAGLAAPALAADYQSSATQYIKDHVETWVEAPEILEAIQAQNDANAVLSQAQIDSLDAAWRAEIDAPNKPTITPILNNPTSDLLRSKIDESNGVIVEAFLMDNRGLNVATAGLTSDYWQGDEAKFTETFGKGAGAMQIGEVEFDESSQTYSVQVSFTIVDAKTATPIGAMTIALNAEALE
jgi:hypothetical protein